MRKFGAYVMLASFTHYAMRFKTAREKEYLMGYASTNSSGAHALPGNRQAFARVVSPGVGQSQILSRPGGWALAYPRVTPGHLTHVFSKDGYVYRERRGLCKS